MDIAFVFKIAAVGIVVAVINQILSKSGRDDYAMLTTALMLLLPKLQMMARTVRAVFDL